MTFALLLIGFVSILGQVVILRELNVAFFGVELIYLLAMGLWLLGTGAGTLLGRRREVSPQAISLLLLLFALLLPAEIVFIRGLRVAFGGVPGAFLPLSRQFIGLLLALLPLGIPLGLLFRWTATCFVSRGRTLAAAYALESTGAVAGGLASTAFLKFGVSNLALGLLCALLTTLAVCVLAFRQSVEGSRRIRQLILALSSVLSLALLFVLFNYPALDTGLTRWNHPHAIGTWDTPYGRVTVTSLDHSISVYENDALSFESQGSAAEEFAHVAALQHPAPHNILLLGGGLDGTVREILKHHPDRVDYVELNGALIDKVLPLLPADVQQTVLSPVVKVTIGDPRMTLETAGRYDLILIGMPEPSSGQTNRFYTRDFYQLVRSHLTPGGVMATRLRSAENFWSEPLTLRNSSIIGTLRSVFPDVLVLPGVTNIILASDDSLPRDYRVLADRFASRAITASLVSPDYLRILYANDRISGIESSLASHPVPVNTDDRPVCYHYAVALWLSKFYPTVFSISAISGRNATFIAIIIVLILVGIFVHFRRRAFRLPLIVAVAGFAGMLLETLLLLKYQVKTGVLYQNIGLLLTLFMLGLTLGALSVDRYVARGRADSIRISGFILLLILVFTSGLSALGVRLALFDGLFPTGILLILSGFSVSAIFSYASFAGNVDQTRLIAPLYAADLVGGALGTVAASLFLIPLAGLAATALTAAFVALLSILVL
jgi:spermidine synthase